MGFPRGMAGGRAGYTLVELMMVVVIIGVSVTAFAPGFSRAMADRRVSIAARELIRVGRRARSDTFGYLRAHLLWITPKAGRVQLLRGRTNSCQLTVWKPVLDTCTTATRRDCLEDFTLASLAKGGSIDMREEQLAGSEVSYVDQAKGRALCFAPNGVTYYGQGADIASATSDMSETVSKTTPGGFVYALHAGTSAPTSTSRVHRVLFPLGASPRALR